MTRRKAGKRLRKKVRENRWRAFRRSKWGGWFLVAGYPVSVAVGLGGAWIVSMMMGYEPDWPVATDFRRGFWLGALTVGAGLWAREVARLLDAGAERERKGAEGEELTAMELRPLRRQGWRCIHDIEYPGEGNVDHLLVGPGAVVAVETKYTSEKLWVTPKAIGGSRRGYIGDAKWSARLAERALKDAGHEDVPVEPALVFWGPGAPEIDRGHTLIQGVLVLEGRKSKRWRGALIQRPRVLDRSAVKAIAVDVERVAVELSKSVLRKSSGG